MFSTNAKKGPSVPVVIAYSTFLLSTLAIVHFVAKGEYSSILTVSALFQCLGIALLFLKVKSTGSAAGISVRALVLDAVAFALRLSSTSWLQGYLPVDATGDWIYQAIDVTSLVMVLCLIYHLLVQLRHTYHAEKDSFPVVPMIICSLVLGSLLCADMNDRPIFDTTWMAGLFIEAVAVLPQLGVMNQSGGELEALTSHYIAMMAVSRMLSGIYMWEARDDITCQPWVEGFNHASFAILGAHALHLLLLGDFAYYYGKALTKYGFELPLVSCNV
jgi:ER lumen protein retaining receptor